MHTAVVALALQLLVVAEPAAPPQPCATPRQAVLNWLTNVRDGDRGDLRRASKCTEPIAGWTRAQKERAVKVLKDVLDAKGVVVHIEQLPDSADYVDPQDYEPIVAVSPLF